MYSSSHPSLPEHITPLLPPPPFEGSTTRKPSDRSLLNEMEKSVASASYPTSDVEDSTVFTARRVRVQELDVLDMPAPAPSSSTSTNGRPLPPGLVPLSSRHAWRDSLSVITGSSNGAGITTDVLDAEPPQAGDGWKSLAGGLPGVSAGPADPSQQRTTFGTSSIKEILWYLNEDLCTLCARTQAPTLHVHLRALHLHPPPVFSHSQATTSSASLNFSRPFGTISPSVRAFGHADPSRQPHVDSWPYALVLCSLNQRSGVWEDAFGHFVFASFASAFMLKLLHSEFAQLLTHQMEDEIFELIGRLITTLQDGDIDERHTLRLMAHIETLSHSHLTSFPFAPSKAHVRTAASASSRSQASIPPAPPSPSQDSRAPPTPPVPSTLSASTPPAQTPGPATNTGYFASVLT
ncbi:hypothetical protein EDD22DRAFT_986505 [Suillus occidentalis]|nr:hypothetical protein EDD22DRAFT_986505 [Suillus occidentalis]